MSGAHALTARDGDDLAYFLAANPGAVIEDVARQRGLTARAILEAFPPGIVRFSDRGDAFADVMHEVAGWGELTTIIHTDDGIFEITGAMPPGAVGSEMYFNLSQPTGLHGHLRYRRCAGFAFVTREFRGKPSAFIALLNVDDGIMFKVFVGRDANRDLRADQLVKFQALADRLCAKPLQK